MEPLDRWKERAQRGSVVPMQPGNPNVATISPILARFISDTLQTQLRHCHPWRKTL